MNDKPDANEEKQENVTSLPMEWTGERFVPWLNEGPPDIHYEHLHRYLFSSQFVEGKRVLDLASGEGYGSAILARKALSVIGVDIDEQAVKHASSRYPLPNLEFIEGSITDIPVEEDNSFDVITCFEAIEHIVEHEKLLSEVKRLLKQDGLFILSSPNKLIYSDQPNYQNPYHLKELYFNDLRKLLNMHFPYALFLGQKVQPISMIWQLGMQQGYYIDYGIQKTDSGFIKASSSDKVPMYFLAIVSMSTLPKGSYFSSLTDISEEYLKYFHRAISERDLLVSEKDRLISDGATCYAEEKEQLVSTNARLIEEMFQYQQSLTDKQQRVISLEEENTSLKAEMSSIQSNIDFILMEKEAQIVDKEKQLIENEEQFVLIENEMKVLKAETSSFLFKRASLEMQVSSLQKQLMLVENALGWRIIKKYRSTMDRLFPLNSGRRKLYELIQKSVKVMLVEGISAFVRKAAGKKEKRQNTKVENTLSPKQQLRHSAILVNEEVTTMDVMVSVVIPTKNAGREFRHLLNMVKNQLGIKEIEIIIVDSGSDDDTINNGLEFGAEIIEIPSEDFSHSGARNLGAEHSKGNYLLFLTQDALPSSNTWLFHMLVALKENDAVAASCIEYPRRDSDLFYRTLSWNHNRFLGLDDRYDLLLSKPELEDPVLWRKNAQLSDVACLIVKDVFEKYRFRSDYAEDLDLGVRLIRDGYRLVLLATNPVIHSHNRSPYYYLKRWYVETLALPKILPGYIVSDVDFDVLVHEIVALYNAVDGLKTRDLFPLNLPCKVRDIKGLATSFRNLITSGSSYHSPYVNKNSHDEKLMVFISNLYSLSSGKPLDNLDMDAFDAMLQSLSSIVNMVWDYIENSYELVDERLVEEFEQSIYKAFAILCGERLADCYQTVRDEFGQARDYIHEELLKGV